MDQTAVSRSFRGAAARAALVASLALLAGCASQPALTAPPDDDLVRATPVSESTQSQPSPPAWELVAPDDPQVQAAMRAWRSGKPAPIIRTSEFIQYPYGLTEAVVTCEPLHVCDVELDTSEEIQNVSIGDSSRWLVHPAFSGARETLTPHVMVKPTEYGIATNAIVTTNRRTYYLGLVSKAEGDPGYIGHRRGDAEVAVVASEWPRQQYGEAVAAGARFELFVYVEGLDGVLDSLRAAGVTVLREPGDMPWGERVAFVSDPNGNPVALAEAS